LLQNVTSLRSLLYYAGIVRTERAPQTHDDLRPVDRPLTSSAGVVAVLRRRHGGDGSRRVLARLLASLLPKVRVERTADPVFSLGR